MQLLFSLLLPQTSYTDAHASSLSSCLHPLVFGFCPCHCLQSHGHLLSIKLRACSSRSSPRAVSVVFYTMATHPLLLETFASFSHGSCHPTPMLFLFFSVALGVPDPLEFHNWRSCLLCPPERSHPHSSTTTWLRTNDQWLLALVFRSCLCDISMFCSHVKSVQNKSKPTVCT